MFPEERLLLYALVCSLKPNTCLEIGRGRGGSTIIISSALDFNARPKSATAKEGILVSLDPERGDHRIEPALAEALSSRVRFIKGQSPDDLGKAFDLAQASFDFVLIDADHTYDACSKDIAAVTGFLQPGAHLLFHDAHFADVKSAVTNSLTRLPFVDCVLLSVAAAPRVDRQGLPVTWAGMRLLRFQPDNRI